MAVRLLLLTKQKKTKTRIERKLSLMGIEYIIKIKMISETRLCAYKANFIPFIVTRAGTKQQKKILYRISSFFSLSVYGCGMEVFLEYEDKEDKIYEKP